MVARRIIPCLDIRGERVTKGKKFQNLVDAGDPVELAARYSAEGADEIVILDISATLEERKPFFETVRKIARAVAIPLTVGGGVRTLDDILELLQTGADKVALNSALAEDGTLVEKAAARVGSQALVGSIDVTTVEGKAMVRTRSATRETGHEATFWARRLADRGIGELLVTSIDRDGMKSGYDVDLLRTLSGKVKLPIIASGGAGTKEHILEALTAGKADAVLAASIFHFSEIGIPELKQYLRSNNIPVRL